MAFGHGRIEPWWAVGLPHPVRGTESVETAITPCPSRGKRTPSLRGPMPPTDTNAGCPIPHSPLLSSFRCMNPVSLRPTDFFRRRLTATLPWPPFSVPALRLVVCRGRLCRVHALAARKCPAMSGLSEAGLEPAELDRESDGTSLQTVSLGLTTAMLVVTEQRRGSMEGSTSYSPAGLAVTGSPALWFRPGRLSDLW